MYVKFVVWIALAGCAGAPRPAAPAPVAAAPAAPAARTPDPAAIRAVWERMARSMPGTWTAQTARGTTVTESFRRISNDSALVEDFHTARGVTASVYHPDHDSLLLTHYCGQGNQPRLRAVDASADAVVFRMIDVTNQGGDQSVLVEKRLRFHADGFEQTEIYRRPDGTTEETTLRFAPAPAAGR